MLSKIFLLCCFLCTYLLPLAQESPFTITSTKTISVAAIEDTIKFPVIRLMGDTIMIANMLTSKVFYLLNDELLQVVNFKNQGHTNKGISAYPLAIADYSGHKIVVKRYNPYDQSLKKLKLGKKFNGEFYVNSGSDNFPKKFVMDHKNELLLLQVNQFNKKKHKKPFKEFCHDYYNTPGLVGIYNKKGRLLRVIGEYPPMYRNQCIDYLRIYSFDYDAEQQLVYLHFAASPEVFVYDLQGTLVAQFGKEGAFANTPAKMPQVLSRMDYIDNQWHYKIKTPYYFNLVRDREAALFFRFYTPAMKDTIVKREQVQVVYSGRQDDRFVCKAPSPLTQKQIDLLNNKPVFVQIYDQHFQLIFDGPSGDIYGFSSKQEGKLVKTFYHPERQELEITFFEYNREVFPGK